MAFKQGGISPTDPTDLSALAQGAAPTSGLYLSSPQSIKVSDTNIINRSLSTSPYWNYRLLTDYSLDKSLPALPDRGEGIAVGANYTVVQQNQGVAVLDNTDDSIIAQQNPNVTVGDTYIYQDHVFEVLSDNNDKPDTGALKDPSPTWLDRGYINPLRMFDGKLDSLTTAEGSLTLTVNSGGLNNGIALFNVGAATVQISVDDATEGNVYDTGQITMRDNSVVLGWHDYFFTPRPAKKDLARIDLPTYPGATITVTLSAPGATVELGEIVLGRVQTLGETQYSSSVGIIDSSRKERDQFGNFNILERPFSKRAEYDVQIMRAATSGVQRILAGYRATPIVYIGEIEEEALIVFGFYRDFQLNYDNFSVSHATITVEGL